METNRGPIPANYCMDRPEVLQVVSIEIAGVRSIWPQQFLLILMRFTMRPGIKPSGSSTPVHSGPGIFKSDTKCVLVIQDSAAPQRTHMPHLLMGLFFAQRFGYNLPVVFLRYFHAFYDFGNTCVDWDGRFGHHKNV